MITSQDIHCFHESLQSKMRTHAPCGTLTSKHMQIFVPRYVPSLLRNKEHTMWPLWPHLHVILQFFSRPTRSPEEEARDILATAAKNQAEDGPNTRRAAVRACKYLRAMVNQYESTIHEVHKAARIHTQMSKGTATADYRPQGGALPVISPELTSELLHCLSTLPTHGPWLRSRSIWRNQASKAT